MSRTTGYRVRRRGGSHDPIKAPRRKGQRYYPSRGQARINRLSSDKVSGSMRRRGNQCRHGRKSKAQTRRRRR